jgi:hypothetical protein
LYVAYLESPNVTHVCVWVQDEKLIGAKGRAQYTLQIISVCGRKKKFLRKPKLRYPGVDGEHTSDRPPMCKICEQVLLDATDLVTELVGS